MNVMEYKLKFVLALVALSALLLGGCGLIDDLIGVEPTSTPTVEPSSEGGQPPVIGAEAAREVVLAHLSAEYPQYAPPADLTWTQQDITSEGLVGSSSTRYSAGGWTLDVTFPLVAPQVTVYTVQVSDDASGFQWNGLVDAYAQVAETSVSTGEDQRSEGVSETPIPPAGQPVVAWVGHVVSLEKGSQFDDYVQLMPQGVGEVGIEGLTPEIQAEIESLRDAGGDQEFVHFWGSMVCPAVDYGGCQLVVTELRYGQFVTESYPMAGWEGRLVCSRFNRAPDAPCGTAFVLRSDFPVWYGVWSQDEAILAELEALRDTGAIVRLWGELIAGVPDVNGTQIRVSTFELAWAPPTSTPEATDTPLPTVTPTPEPPPCNAISLIEDVTIEDGTLFAPGANFTKTWRLKNVGTCTWTSEYDLVFVQGDQMEARRALALPEQVRPDEIVDVSVALTAPSEAGDYRGYWMLRDENGQEFGWGDDADEAFWVDIEVVVLDNDYAYDFALNYCAATWRSETMRLHCPGLTSSVDGFVTLLDQPALENRNENEFTLWVHPNEERYGWIEGTYPLFEVEQGDTFKAWVGCLAGENRCDLTFYLGYETQDGQEYMLEEWVEDYDGKVTDISLDLSDLAGEAVRFILGTEANTLNVGDAHGFWFVPRIER
jgi:hypothetical protein